VLPGRLWFVSRRCFERRFLMRPSEETNAIILYCLAVAAKRYGIQLHAYCFLSNHLHMVLTDPRGNLPAFAQYMDSLIARALNTVLGRWEWFWAPGSFSGVQPETAADVLEKMAYTLANPVAAGLVRRGKEWPGVRSTPEQIGAGKVMVKKPERFFRKGGPMPEEVELEVVCPAGLGRVEEVRAALARRVEELEDEAARRLGEEGRTFLGAKRVKAQKPSARPAPVERRRGLRPRVACRDVWKRIEALQRLKRFLGEYRVAWNRYARGMRDTVFPAGTYWMKVAYGVRCEAAG
jgi:REP element-mobilizing transposase RayT